MESVTSENPECGPCNLVVVCGPTASGKTSLAVALSSRFDGEIISADSRQVYCGLDIGSGKDLAEYSGGGEAVPYHLIDIADPCDLYTLYHYQHDFYRVFNEISSRGRLPVLCGGTGLYIEAVVRGYAVPSVPEDRGLRMQLMEKDRQELDAMLLKLDPVRYSVTDRNSKKRIVRAIEVTVYVQKKSPEQGEAAAVRSRLNPLVLCTRWDRATLRRRIDERLEDRFSQGMVEEVQQLRNKGVPDERLLMLGMEYKFITQHLRGELDFENMKAALRQSIYQLAKRQETYFRGMERRCAMSFRWVDNADAAAAVEEVAKRLGRLT